MDYTLDNDLLDMQCLKELPVGFQENAFVKKFMLCHSWTGANKQQQQLQQYQKNFFFKPVI